MVASRHELSVRIRRHRRGSAGVVPTGAVFVALTAAAQLLTLLFVGVAVTEQIPVPIDGIGIAP